MSQRHRWPGLLGSMVLAAGPFALARAPTVDAVDIQGCDGAFGIPFPVSAGATPLSMHGSGVPDTELEELAASLDPLIRSLQQDLGPLLNTEICVASLAALPEAALLNRPDLRPRAEANGPAARVAVFDEGLANDRLTDAVATGLIHVALWQASAGGYPVDFERDVIGWYLAGSLGRRPARELPSGAASWREASWEPSKGLVEWDPDPGYAYAGRFAEHARSQGVAFRSPDVTALQGLAETWMPPATTSSTLDTTTTSGAVTSTSPVTTAASTTAAEPVPSTTRATVPTTTAATGAGPSWAADPWLVVMLGVVAFSLAVVLAWVLARDYRVRRAAPPPPMAVPPTAAQPLAAPAPRPAALGQSASPSPARTVPARPPSVPQLGEAAPSAEVTGPIRLWQADSSHEVAIDSGMLNGFEVRAATITGAKNRLSGIPCQDAFAVAQAAGRFLVVAGCDGVGSARLSHLGAQATANRLVADLTATLESGAALARVNAPRLIAAAGDALTSLAAGHPGSPEVGLFATTAVAIAVDTLAGPMEPGLLAFRVGDSTVRLLDATGTWIDLFDGPGRTSEDSLLSTATVALPCDPGLAQAVCIAWWAGSPVVAMTDGLANALRDSAQATAYFGEAWASPPDPLAFAADLAFRRRGAIDDRTAIAVWRPLQEPASG